MIVFLEPKTSQKRVIRRLNANFICLKIYYSEQYQELLIKSYGSIKQDIFLTFFLNQTLSCGLFWFVNHGFINGSLNAAAGHPEMRQSAQN